MKSRCPRGVLVGLVAAVVSAIGRPALAQAPDEATQGREDATDERSRPVQGKPPRVPKAEPVPTKGPDVDPPIAGDERPVPNYDGREEPTTVGDVALWVPRVALSPLYFVSEFVIRRPLGWLVTTAEEEKWPAILIDFFTFGPERKAGVVPTGLIDFGFRPSIGLYFFWNDFIADDNDLRLRASWGGPDWLLFAAADRINLGEDETIALRGTFEQRPDWVFHGLGPRSRDEDEARYFRRLYEVDLRYERRLPRSSSFSSGVGVRDVTTDSGIGCCGDPTVSQRLAEGAYAAPPGLDSEYTIAYENLELALDTRARRDLEHPREGSDFVSPPGSGVRIAVHGEHSSTLTRAPSGPAHPQWLRYGGTLGGFVDVTGEQRTLGLLLTVDFVDPFTRGSEIPFTEQVRLGGDYVMQGGLQGRLVGRSAAVARFEYQWPVWVWLDGTAFYEAGNVFGERLDGFDLDLLRSSFGFGVRTIGSRDNPFQATIAFLTETFEAGHGLDTVRFVFGTTRGF